MHTARPLDRYPLRYQAQPRGSQGTQREERGYRLRALWVLFNQIPNQMYWGRVIHNGSFLSRRYSVYKAN
jgi:hypothetical protein